MQQVHLIFGYGIPDNIFVDENYLRYLSTACNQIFDAVGTAESSAPPTIICSGGPTDMVPPYSRTEAAEMLSLFASIANRPCMQATTKDWQYIAEDTSISTLENIINCTAIINDTFTSQTELYIYCEYTRRNRIRTLAEHICSTAKHLHIVPIDFDMSPSRYLDRDFISKKEAAELKHALWALESESNMNQHHALFEEKLAYFRSLEPEAHTDAMAMWWREKFEQYM